MVGLKTPRLLTLCHLCSRFLSLYFAQSQLVKKKSVVLYDCAAKTVASRKSYFSLFLALFIGMVTISAPDKTVNYKSNQSLICAFDESTDHSGWNLSKPFERFELNTGRQIMLANCLPSDYPSCVNVTLLGVTGILAGKFLCFSNNEFN